MNPAILKPYLFVFLYIITGIIGWQAVSAISNEDTSLPAIKHYMATHFPGGSYFSETSSAEANDTLSSNIAQLKKYEEELEQLRNLPPEVLPEGIIKPKEKEHSLFDSLPQWEEGGNTLNFSPEEPPLIKRLRDPLSREQFTP